MNLIVRLLLELGILKLKQGDWAEIKNRQKAEKRLTKQQVLDETDFSHDPITAPRRAQDDNDFRLASWRETIITFIVATVVIGLLVYASSVWVWSDHTPEKDLRAEWQNKTRNMTCMGLKQIIENDPSNLPSVAWQFSYWEYVGAEKVYPSPRPDDQCYKETGYLKDDVKKCGRYGVGFSCEPYLFERDESTKTIHFPNDWFYIDLQTEKRYTNPQEYINDIHPDLRKWNAIIGD